MHFWIWINEPQHGTAIQAVAALVYTLASIVVGGFAIATYRQTRKQTEIAIADADAARERYEEQREELKRERSLREMQARSAFVRTVNEEEAEKPQWKVQHFIREGRIDQIICVNEGKTAAIDVHIRTDTGLKPNSVPPLINPGGKIDFKVPVNNSAPIEINLEFQTVFGTLWKLRFRNTGPSSIWPQETMGVERRYIPPID